LFCPCSRTLLLSLTISFRPEAATTERIVVDRHSGIAFGGLDPVAYFVDADAMREKGEFEHAFAGVVCRFRNEGNRAAFWGRSEDRHAAIRRPSPGRRGPGAGGCTGEPPALAHCRGPALSLLYAGGAGGVGDNPQGSDRGGRAELARGRGCRPDQLP